MQSKATSVEQYLAELPEDRRAVVSALRQIFLENLPEGYAEGMSYGMIGYCVPHAIYPAGYHCDPRQPLPFAGLAAQKNHYSLYLFCIYGSEELTSRFREQWEAAGKKLDMGKGCVRFKRLEDVPLEVVGEAIRSVPVEKFIAIYEQNIRGATRAKPSGEQPKSTTSKKTSAKPASKSAPKPGKKPAKKSATKKAVEKSPATKVAKKVAKKAGKTSGRKTATARAGKVSKPARSPAAAQKTAGKRRGR